MKQGGQENYASKLASVEDDNVQTQAEYSLAVQNNKINSIRLEFEKATQNFSLESEESVSSLLKLVNLSTMAIKEMLQNKDNIPKEELDDFMRNLGAAYSFFRQKIEEIKRTYGIGDKLDKLDKKGGSLGFLMRGALFLFEELERELGVKK